MTRDIQAHTKVTRTTQRKSRRISMSCHAQGQAMAKNVNTRNTTVTLQQPQSNTITGQVDEDPCEDERQRGKECEKENRKQMPPPKEAAAQGNKYRHPNSRERSRSPRRSRGADNAHRARMPPRSHGGRSRERNEDKPKGSRQRSGSHHSVKRSQTVKVDVRDRLNEIKAAKDAVYFGPPCFADNI